MDNPAPSTASGTGPIIANVTAAITPTTTSINNNNGTTNLRTNTASTPTSTTTLQSLLLRNHLKRDSDSPSSTPTVLRTRTDVDTSPCPPPSAAAAATLQLIPTATCNSAPTVTTARSYTNPHPPVARFTVQPEYRQYQSVPLTTVSLPRSEVPTISPGPRGTRTTMIVSSPRPDLNRPLGFLQQYPNYNGVNFERLKSEQARLDTFYNPSYPWPVEFVEPRDCAKAGFFFLQNGDKVQCAFCRGVAGEWERGDVPINEHKKHFPRCPFVCNLPVGNVPIGREAAQATGMDPSNVSVMGYDVCGPFDSRFGLSGHVRVRGAQPLTNDIDDVTRSLAINTGTGPARTHLVTEDARLKTFTGWPSSTGQTPKKLAEAGFYYIGMRDHVKCFYCDGGLRNWEESDDPWCEHARWFQSCPFVLINKGEEFVKKAKESKPLKLGNNNSNSACSSSAAAVASAPAEPPNPPSTTTSYTSFQQPRRVTDEELRNMIDTPIVQAALEMGMEVSKVKAALQNKLQRTGTPFLTTEALIESILGRGREYDSDLDSYSDDEEDEEYISFRRPTVGPPRFTPICVTPTVTTTIAAPSTNEPTVPPTTTTTEVIATVATEQDEPATSESNANKTTDAQLKAKLLANRTVSGGSDSGISSNAGGSAVVSSDDESTPTTTTSSPSTSQKDTSELEEEVRRLREARQCKICMDNEVCVVFLPCGHLVSCSRCATALTNCALCRQPIKAMVRTYLS